MEGAEQLAASKSLRPDPVEADAPEDALSTWLGGVGFIFFFNPGGPRLCPGSPGSRLASLRDVACEDLPRSASLFLVGQHKEPGGKKKQQRGKQSCFWPCHCHCQCDVAPRAWAVHGCVRCQLAKKPKQLSLRNVLSPDSPTSLRRVTPIDGAVESRHVLVVGRCGRFPSVRWKRKRPERKTSRVVVSLPRAPPPVCLKEGASQVGVQ